MNACKGAYSGEYIVWLGTQMGQAPHEVTYPYMHDEPTLACPKDAKIFNAGAKLVTGMRDYECDEDKLKQLVKIKTN